MRKLINYFFSVLFIILGIIFILLSFSEEFGFFTFVFGALYIYLGFAIYKAYKKKIALEEYNKTLRLMNTYVAGVRYNQEAIVFLYNEDLKSSEYLVELKPDPNNEYNNKAVEVYVNDYKVGFIPDRRLDKYYFHKDNYEYIDSKVEFIKKGYEIFLDLNIYFKEV